MNDRTGLNWSSIVTNAVSTLVAAVFVGAAIIVWSSATTIDQQVEEATENIKSEQKKLINTQVELEAARETLQGKVASLEAKIEVLSKRLESNDSAIETIAAGGNSGDVSAPKPAPSEAALQALEREKLRAITEAYDTKRFQLQQQLPGR